MKSARAGNRTRVEASTTPHDNRYTTRAGASPSGNRYLRRAQSVVRDTPWPSEKLRLKRLEKRQI